MTDHTQRFREVQRAYFNAEDNYRRDLQDCEGDQAKMDAVTANLQNLETETYRAARSALNQTGAAVEAAYQAAKKAREDVLKKRKEAASIADRISAVAKNLDSVKTLIDAASTRTAQKMV